jgi:glucosylceramidase
VRIGCSSSGSSANVAFKTPTGKTVVLLLNDGAAPQTYTIKTSTRTISTVLPTGAAGTYIW